tara:strand:- start:2772 stop:3272 length:501 start_codon:yes stop_codon:yes gene_type:complete
MSDVGQVVTDEAVDQVIKILKDKATAKLLKLSKEPALSDMDIQSKLRSMGFKDIANDPKKYGQFRKLSKLSKSEFKWRLARLLVGAGTTLSKGKYLAIANKLPDSAKVLTHGAFAVARGSAKDFAEKYIKRKDFRQVLDKPELMKSIAESLREQNTNSFTKEKLRE